MNARDNGYTQSTRIWLNKRFDLLDADGVYIPNQPAYGFETAAYRLEEYARMFAILRVLNQLSFKTLLDVGCADGYGQALIERLFGARTVGIDLSDRALVRSRELFNSFGASADAHHLPFPDNAFDVSICSEVLEHVVDPAAVLAELKRVTRDHVVFSTPRAPDPATRDNHFRNLDPGEPHAHIQYFTDEDIRLLCGPDCRFLGARARFVNRVFDRLAWADSSSLDQRNAYYQFMAGSTRLDEAHLNILHSMLIGRYNKKNNLKKRLITRSSVSLLLRLDTLLASKYPSFALDHLVIIPLSKLRDNNLKKLGIAQILDALLGGLRVKPLRRTT